MTDSIDPDKRALIERTRKVNKVLSMFVFALQECSDLPAENQLGIADMLKALEETIRERVSPGILSMHAGRIIPSQEFPDHSRGQG